MKVQNSYQKSTIAEAVQINDEKDEMEKPHFLCLLYTSDAADE